MDSWVITLRKLWSAFNLEHWNNGCRCWPWILHVGVDFFPLYVRNSKLSFFVCMFLLWIHLWRRCDRPQSTSSSSCFSSQVKRLTAPYPWVTMIFLLWWRESWTHKRCVLLFFFTAQLKWPFQPTYNYTEHELKRETLTFKDLIWASRSGLDLEDIAFNTLFTFGMWTVFHWFFFHFCFIW